MNKKVNRKAHVNQKQCVACGYCMNNCPLNAIIIHNGIYAQVELDKCVGCSKCSRICPSAAINMIDGGIANA